MFWFLFRTAFLLLTPIFTSVNTCFLTCPFVERSGKNCSIVSSVQRRANCCPDQHRGRASVCANHREPHPFGIVSNRNGVRVKATARRWSGHRNSQQREAIIGEVEKPQPPRWSTVLAVRSAPEAQKIVAAASIRGAGAAHPGGSKNVRGRTEARGTSIHTSGLAKAARVSCCLQVARNRSFLRPGLDQDRQAAPVAAGIALSGEGEVLPRPDLRLKNHASTRSGWRRQCLHCGRSSPA